VRGLSTSSAAVQAAVPAAVAVLTASVTLNREPLWADELASLAIVDRPLSAVFAQFPGEHNGVLFHLLLWPLVSVVGTGATATRMLSVAAIGVAAALTAVVGRRLAGPAEGFAAGIALAVHPYAVYYGQEARMYALAAALVVASTLALLRALERPTSARWAVYALSVAAVGYTHDLALLCVLPQLVLVRGAADRARRGFAAALAGTAVLLVPLVVLAAADAGSQPLYWVHRPTPQSIKGVVGFVCGSAWIALAAAALALALAYRRRSVRPRTRAGRFVAVWLFLPAAALIVVSYAKPLLVDRYLIGSIPAFAIGLSMVTFRLGRLGRIAFAVLVAGLLVLTVRQEVRLTKPDLPGADRLLAEQGATRDQIVLSGDARLVLSGILYYGDFHPARRLVWTDPEVASVPRIFAVSDPRPGRRRSVDVRPGTVWVVGATSVPAANAHCTTLRVWRLRGLDVAKTRCVRR